MSLKFEEHEKWKNSMWKWVVWINNNYDSDDFSAEKTEKFLKKDFRKIVHFL